VAGCSERGAELSNSIKGRFIVQESDCQLLKKDSALCS
jgi:hypothetical protein